MAVARTRAGDTIQVTKHTLAQPYIGVAPLVASSGTKANADAVATLTPPSDKSVAFMCGLIITSSGATADKVVPVTVTGIGSGSVDIATHCFVNGLKNPSPVLNLTFDPPIRAMGPNVPIRVTVPASGGGGTNLTLFLWGYSSTTEDIMPSPLLPGGET